MKIDIITYTDAQYAKLSEEQLLEVQEAQIKKNNLDRKLAQEMAEEKNRLLKRGIFLSKIWELYCEKLQAQYAAEVEALRESLLFYLRFSSRPDSSTEGNVPYLVDYSLEMTERFNTVRDYYLETYTDAVVRYEEFLKDSVAPVYLGELYAPLHDLFGYLAQQQQATTT